MALFSFDFKKIFKRKVSPQTLGRFGSPFRKERDWKILLVIIAVLAVTSLVWSLYLFFRINSGTIFRHVEEEKQELSIFDRKALREKVLEITTINYEFNKLRGR